MKIAVFGAGFVGLVTAACFAEHGHELVVIDPNAARVDAILAGKAPFHEPGLDALLQAGRSSGLLHATTDASEAADADIIFLAVGTPTHDGKIDLGQIEAASAEVGRLIKGRDGFPVVVVKSTVVPGTTSNTVRAALESATGGKAGVDFGLCMNPEFLRESSAVADFQDPDRIVIGASDPETSRIMTALYQRYDCPVHQTTLNNAEMCKYASNTLLATMISFSNELARMCEAMPDTEIEQVMDTLADDRRLSPRVDGALLRPGMLSYLRPGIGYGGSCLPKDVAALRHAARQVDVQPDLLDAVDGINQDRPATLIDRLGDAMGGLDGKRVAVLGLAFKPGTDDVRESPGLKAITVLRARGAVPVAFDPMVSSLQGDFADVEIAASLEACLSDADAAIVATAWPEFAACDWEVLIDRMAGGFVLDGRNLLAQQTRPVAMHYIGVGQMPASA